MKEVQEPSDEEVQLISLIKESITLLCKTTLRYDLEVTVDGLLGITLDKKSVLLVNIKENIVSDSYEPKLQEDNDKTPKKCAVEQQKCTGQDSVAGLSDDISICHEKSDDGNKATAQSYTSEGMNEDEDHTENSFPSGEKTAVDPMISGDGATKESVSEKGSFQNSGNSNTSNADMEYYKAFEEMVVPINFGSIDSNSQPFVQPPVSFSQNTGPLDMSMSALSSDPNSPHDDVIMMQSLHGDAGDNSNKVKVSDQDKEKNIKQEKSEESECLVVGWHSPVGVAGETLQLRPKQEKVTEADTSEESTSARVSAPVKAWRAFSSLMVKTESEPESTVRSSQSLIKKTSQNGIDLVNMFKYSTAESATTLQPTYILKRQLSCTTLNSLDLYTRAKLRHRTPRDVGMHDSIAGLVTSNSSSSQKEPLKVCVSQPQQQSLVKAEDGATVKDSDRNGETDGKAKFKCSPGSNRQRKLKPMKLVTTRKIGSAKNIILKFHQPSSCEVPIHSVVSKEKPKRGTLQYTIQEAIRVECDRFLGSVRSREDLVAIEARMDFEQKKTLAMAVTTRLTCQFPELKENKEFFQTVLSKVRKCLSNKLYWFRNHLRSDSQLIEGAVQPQDSSSEKTTTIPNST